MKHFKIINTEICDNAVKDENDNYPISGISVAVTAEIDKKEYCLEFQTSSTMDYGAISSDLEINDDDTFDELKDLFDDDDDFFGLIDAIKDKSQAQKVWREYIEKNYTVDEGHFEGMDANSEINRMKKI